ncbi:MAG: adenylate/guanylate cyclase domain-containing protein [Opitutaceae bacterium]
MSSPTALRLALRTIALPLGVIIVVTFLTFLGVFAPLDRFWFDRLQRQFESRVPVPEDTAFVLIDEQSLQALGRDPFNLRWPWPRAAFAALLIALDRSGAREIVVDLLFLENSDAAQDAVLGAVAAGLTNVTLAAKSDLDRNVLQLPVVWPEELRKVHPGLFESRQRWGLVNSRPDSDGIIRSYPLDRSLAESIPFDRDSSIPIPGLPLLRWRGNLERLKERGVPAVPAAPFVAEGWWMLDRATTEVPDLDPGRLIHALENEERPQGEVFDQVRGRIVFVGANAAGAFDAVATPVGAPEPGVIVHWTAAANLRFHDFINPIGTGLTPLVLVVMAIGLSGRHRMGLRRPGLIAGGAALASLTASAALFDLGFWLPPATPVVGAVLAFTAVAVESFRSEQARKREIQGWFGAYVSPQVVKRLIENPEALKLGGERREVSVLFSDIVGFTPLSERLSAEALVGLTNTCLEELSAPILDQGGYLDKYIGDAIMGVFGTPELLENHALAACRAALECRRRLSRLNDRLDEDFGVRIGVRFGINTGEVVVGNVGSERKKNYTALGDAVNLASRLEGANKEFHTDILIGPETATRVASEVALRPVARLRVKGKEQAVEVFEPLGEHPQINAALQEFVTTYRNGYNAFCERRFSEAVQALTAAAVLQPDDFMTTRYLTEARRFAADPPASDWEPVLQLQTK